MMATAVRREMTIFKKNIHKYSMAHSKRVPCLPGCEAVLKQYQNRSGQD